MRKRITSKPQRESSSANTSWLDLEALARVEVTSEDAAHPIESALLTIGAIGWRAESPGEQTIRLLFDAPQRLRRIRLLFREESEARTQEFVLRWSPTTESSWRDVVRQRSEEHTSELQSRFDLVCRLLLEKKKNKKLY